MTQLTTPSSFQVMARSSRQRCGSRTIWDSDTRGAVFIDLNPAGQWLFLPEPVSGAVARAIAEHLQGT
jgi:hypothetical protein